MMRRTWLVWTIYACCLLLALPALAWLSSSALNLERSERAARRAAEHEKQIRLASWRIDTRLMPLISQEAARPFSDYGHLAKLERTIPPLSSEPSDYALSYFQGRQGNFQISAPQIPHGMNLANPLPLKALDEQQLLFLAFRDLPAPPDGTAAPVQIVRPLSIAGRALKLTKSPQPDSDFALRQQAVESNAALENVKQRSAPSQAISTTPVNLREGASRPLWIGDSLVLARRVRRGSTEIVQGLWIDWGKLCHDLQLEVADLIPDVRLEPTGAEGPTNFAHTLASLPVQLVVPDEKTLDESWTPLRIGLALAWTGFILAAIAAAGILAGMIALNRRREAFVSAVTHELRTPLTTFRMYSEMLDAGMVRDEERPRYLRTLRVEADRLWHLVENVLAYARIERGRRAVREHISLGQLWNRIEPRLIDRAAAAEMELTNTIEPGAEAAPLLTDPAAVEQILFNLVDNACKYAADGQRIHIELAANDRQVSVRVDDRGPGISSSDARKLFRPFAKSAARAAETAPGVGLGLALCRDLARQLGGDLRYETAAHGGALFILALPRS